MTFSEAIKALQLDASASKGDIRKAYRRLVVLHHPDKFQDDIDKQIAEKNFKKIQEAYELLSDLKPAINIEDRMTRSGYDKDSDAIKANLDELLKMRPLDESEGMSWSGVSSVQGIIVKFLIFAIPLYVLSMVILFKWGAIKRFFSGLF